MAKKKKLTKAEQIAKMSPEMFSKIKNDEAGRQQLISYLRTLNSGYNRRISSFRRNHLVSHAEISFEASFAKSPRKELVVKNLTRNQLLLEIARYSKFFNDKTSSVAGIKEVNKEQDKRIFGTDKRGRPLKTMTAEERTLYWTIYDEFKNMFPEWRGQPYSESIQTLLADVMFEQDFEGFKDLEDEDYTPFESMTLMEKLIKLEKDMRERQTILNLEDVPNVLSGKGPRFQE